MLHYMLHVNMQWFVIIYIPCNGCSKERVVKAELFNDID